MGAKGRYLRHPKTGTTRGDALSLHSCWTSKEALLYCFIHCDGDEEKRTPRELQQEKQKNKKIATNGSCPGAVEATKGEELGGRQ